MFIIRIELSRQWERDNTQLIAIKRSFLNTVETLKEILNEQFINFL